MSEQLLTVAGLLILLMVAMLILAGLALTLRGFQTLNATIVSLLAMGLHKPEEKPAENGGNLRSDIEDGQASPDPPPDFGNPPADRPAPGGAPPSRPSRPNGRRGV